MPRGTHPLVHLFTLDESFSSEQQDRLVELLKIAGLAACVDFPPRLPDQDFSSPDRGRI